MNAEIPNFVKRLLARLRPRIFRDKRKVSFDMEYEDIKDRFRWLEEREIVLQKQVARLSEKVDWLTKLREEKRKKKEERGVSKRWKIGLAIGALISFINLVLNLLGVL